MDELKPSVDLIGTGTYTVYDAHRLSNVPPSRIRRWLLGQSRTYAGDLIYDPPLWSSSLPLIDDGLYLSFRDLIELRVTDRFRQQHLSMPYIRKVLAAARETVQDSHPFSTSHFKTDGRRLYLEILSKTEEPKLIEVLSGQHVFHSVISDGLRDVEFRDGIASLWRPEAGKGEVVVDPQRSFGKPILERYGIATSTIRSQAEAGRTLKQVAADFEIDMRAAKAAMTFEARLAA
jgi:uncharacterized protein (DUF433 family)